MNDTMLVARPEVLHEVRSRTSPMTDVMPAATSATWNSAGSVGGASAKPVTSVPILPSHSAVQLPLKPV